MRKIRVLIVDDSSIIRSLLNHIFSSDNSIEVVGSAPDPYVAREMLPKLKPDVMTLDVEMPRMDGITFLTKVMAHFPIRTVIFSSLTQKNSEMALRAMEAGAIDVVAKPAIDVRKGVEEIRDRLLSVVKAAAQAKIRPIRKIAAVPTAGKVGGGSTQALAQTTHQVLAIAASTGGTTALKEVLSELPADIPGTLIVQHLPAAFTKSFADSLNEVCAFEVKEAEEGDRVIPGRALLAPGDFHMELVRNGAFYYVTLHQKPQRHAVRPAADYMMESVAKYAGSNAVGLVLTGMGKDGAEGLLAMKNVGSYNIAQDEATSVVFGMPGEAIKLNAVQQVCPIHEIPSMLVKRFKYQSVA